MHIKVQFGSDACVVTVATIKNELVKLMIWA